MNLVGEGNADKPWCHFQKRLFSAKAKCFKQIQRADSFPLLCLGGGVGQWVHGCNRCLLFSEKAWQVMVMMKINSLPLLSPFLWKTIFVRRPGNTSGGRDGSRALDRSFAVRDDRTESDRAFCYLSSHCSKNGAPNFFSPFVLFFTSSQRCHIC